MNTNTLDDKLIKQCDLSVRHRRRIELLIARKTIAVLREANFRLQSDNGEEETCWDASDDVLIENLFACDEGHLYVTTKRNGEPQGWVFFVLGNDGYDVICDYTTNLEPQLQQVTEFTDKLEEEGQ